MGERETKRDREIGSKDGKKESIRKMGKKKRSKEKDVQKQKEK